MSIIFTILAAYLILLGLMFIFQNRLIFFPSPHLLVTPGEAGLIADDTWMDTKDGERLHGWYFPNEEAEYVVVLSHGNAGNISNRIDIAKLLGQVGVAVVLYDYRGYGKSTGKPTEQGLYHDIEAVVEYLKTERGYSESQMIMYGRSLGGAMASYAALRYKVSGLVLDSAFKDLKSMVGDLYPFIPGILAKYEFSSEKHLKEIHDIPIMVMHSRNDDIVGFSHAGDLYKIAGNPKQFVELEGGHNDNFYASIDLFRKSWKNFLQTVEDQRRLSSKEAGG